MSSNGHTPVVKTNFHNPQYYINRELSWVDFNERVMEEAEDPTQPLLERLKFLMIFSSNLDEFFMIRIAGLKEQVSVGVVDLAPDGMTPQQQLRAVGERLRPLVERHSRLLTQIVLPELAANNIVVHPFASLPEAERERLRVYFMSEALPVLTPLAVDPGHPFPHLPNRSLNIAFVVRDNQRHRSDNEFHFAVVQVPGVLGRFIRIFPDRAGDHFVLLEEVVAAYASALFAGLKVVTSFNFRVTRDADIEIAEDEADDLMKMMEEQVRQRKWGEAVRLEVDEHAPQMVLDILTESLELTDADIYRTSCPLNLADFSALYRLDYRDLKDRPFISRVLPAFRDEERSVFSVVRDKDIMLHHPFESFSTTVDFIRAAARDPKVLAIKQTLYRAGGDSPVIAALAEAAENGKQVTALVELKARFDEENNIVWAKKLEQAGVHVVYGLIGLKTHCKIAMIVRRDEVGTPPRIYIHLSTGNYNIMTSRHYTDIGLITANPDFGTDGINLFNFLTGYGAAREWNKLAMAPLNLREKILELIEREIATHTAGKPGRIIAKLNAIVDGGIIRALYRASQAGVKIDLLVRGICCLRPGLEGISDNIRVISIVGRFLEHSRIFYFRNGGDEQVFLSSADWMPRNLNRRVEVMYPVEDPDNRQRLKNILDIYLSDTVKARELQADGTYIRIPSGHGGESVATQEYFLRQIRQEHQIVESPRAKSLRNIDWRVGNEDSAADR